MGIRIHKSLGYGLDDLVEDDPRLARPFYEVFDELDRDRMEYEFISFARSIADKHDELYVDLFKRDELEDRNPPLYYSVVQDSEFGSENVALFIPPGHKDWVRYDDIIDYYESEEFNPEDPMEPRVQLLDKPIWPYDGWSHKGESLTNNAYKMFDLIRTLKRDNRESSDIEKILLEEYGMNYDEIRPTIPFILAALLKFVRLFKEDSTIYTLKPMIYTYWS